ncbi:MAG: amidohydrolase family protein [Saprospiraceae bacterium]|nr:amidohydrolase family protein [Saprospiraceae bacterium]
MQNFKHLAALAAILFTFCASAQTTYLHCGKLIDCVGNSAQSEMTIVVEGNRITEVRKGYATAPTGSATIDLRSKTVMPGLMDMHVHLEGESNPKSYEEKFRLNPSDVAYQAEVFGKKTLMAGFTTVRDLGGSGVNVSLRNAINAGLVEGPRIFTAEKSIATTGGHADPTNGVKKDMMGDPGPAEGVINSADEAWEAVRHRYKNGADLIKITATGGVLSMAANGLNPQFREEEIEAVVAAAKDYGMTVAAHCHGADGMLRAVQAGVTSIEHGTFMTDEIMDLMKKKGTYYVPTISAGRFVAEKAKQSGYFPAMVAAKAAIVGPQIQATFSKAYKAGVKIAFGTDAGVSQHGQNAWEFVFMNEGGMPPMEAIKAATVTTAGLIGKSADLGTIEKGKIADIVAVDGDPLADMKAMLKMKFVMKEGKVYRNDE